MTASMGPSAAGSSDPPTPPSPPSPASSVSSSVDPADMAGDDDSVSRPSIFPAGKHAPAARSAPFEEYYGHGPGGIRRLELLTELKSSRLEGLYNLAFLVLAFALVYIAMRNVVETGFHVRLSNICTAQLIFDSLFCGVFALISTAVLSAITLSLVLLQIRGLMDPSAAFAIHVLTSITAMVMSSATIVASSMNPLSGSVLAVIIVIVLLKLHSFFVTNQLLAEETLLRRNARRERRAASTPGVLRDLHVHPSTDSLNGASESSSKSSLRRTVTLNPHMSTTHSAQLSIAAPSNSYSTASTRAIAYPKNVTMGNFLYFLVAPVLVYETSYPRTERIRLGYVAWFGVQSVLCMIVQLFLLLQFCVPIFYQSRAADDYEILYYIMKLAIPSLAIWLLFFWGFFHCTLNTIAELLRFADRGFYQDWWNSTTLGSFWRKWNVPVHEWCLRHLYVESVTRRNVRARTASLATFVFSALVHEYVVATGFKVQPFSLSMPYMFMGMAVQIPLMSLSKHLEHSRKGNLLMWFMLFLGQPLISILYVRQYIGDHGYIMCSSE